MRARIYANLGGVSNAEGDDRSAIRVRLEVGISPFGDTREQVTRLSVIKFSHTTRKWRTTDAQETEEQEHQFIMYSSVCVCLCRLDEAWREIVGFDSCAIQ